MSITVFTWDMFKGGVGHASLYLNSKAGSIYISFWPEIAGNARSGLYSKAKVNFINRDKELDGQPSWASKPLNDLDEEKIIKWWSQFQAAPLINYKSKTGAHRDGSANAVEGVHYNILTRQCSTMVVQALFEGANIDRKLEIGVWVARNSGQAIPTVRSPTITPKDVRLLVTSIWGDI